MKNLLLGTLLVGLVSCGSPNDGAIRGVEIGGSGVSLAAFEGGWALTRRGRATASSAVGQPALIREVDDDALMQFGSFYFDEVERSRHEGTEAVVANEVVQLPGVGSITFEPVDEGVVRGRVAPEDAAGGRVILRMACGASTRFAGLGAQVHRLDQRGRRVPMWVAEQGNGKKVGATMTDFPAGDLHDSYFPIPWLFDPAGGWGLLVEGTSRVVFDLCAEDPAAWTIEVRSARWSFLFVQGDSPLQILERMTAQTGRQALPNPWALGVWTDAVRGQEAVLEHARALRAAGAPVSAIWSEDWAGSRENSLTGFGLTYRWEVDEDLYPDLPGMIRELETMGFAFLGYFNTFLQQEAPEWEVAVREGHLVTDAQGSPYTFPAPSLRPTGLVDVTRPETRAWMGDHMRAAADLGIRGWMADFAEWLPVDGRTAAGPGWDVHNDYPRHWASLNREVLEGSFPDGDWIFFSRSGWTGSWTSSPMVWGGDQNTDWEALDGLPSALALGLNLGASGVPFYASDIGGYASLAGVEHRTKELWQRWTEFSAWTPLMRTHHGHEAAENWQLLDTDRTHSDAETLTHFVKFARLHQSLLPYLRGLAAEAEARGWPLMRSMVLHYPAHDEAWRSDQYLLGEHVLVAPVLERGADSRRVWLPPGRWTPWEGGAPGERLTGPAEIEVAAPVGTVPVFLAEGAVVPIFPEPPDTLVGWESPGLSDLTPPPDLEVHYVDGEPGSFTLAGGARLIPGEALPGRSVRWVVR